MAGAQIAPTTESAEKIRSAKTANAARAVQKKTPAPTASSAKTDAVQTAPKTPSARQDKSAKTAPAKRDAATTPNVPTAKSAKSSSA